MNDNLYPLKFTPLYQYRLWGGRRLENWLAEPLPPNENVGEAWLLSDREDFNSRVADGKWKGYTLSRLLEKFPQEIMGKNYTHMKRFPLLLKYLDCNEVLSVQVHPSDDQTSYIPKGDTGKTEAWVVLESANDGIIYAGLKPGTTRTQLEKAVHDKNPEILMHHFKPKKDDAVFIKSGTVHTLGGAVVFEVQENSDVTYRLYDWDRKDAKTGKPRELQIEEAMACVDFDIVNVNPVVPQYTKNGEEKLFEDKHFETWRLTKNTAFGVGNQNEPTILVCLDGEAKTTFENQSYTLVKGEVMLLPAALGELDFVPQHQVRLLQITIPQNY